MMQTRRQSLVESLTNIAIGYTTNVVANMVIFPIFGIDTTISDNLLIGLCFTVVSLTRTYIIRRYFNKHEIDRRSQ